MFIVVAQSYTDVVSFLRDRVVSYLFMLFNKSSDVGIDSCLRISVKSWCEIS